MKNKILKLNEKLEWEEINFQAEDDVVPYEVLSEAIGGLIEHVTFNLALEKCGIDVWIDEEGKIKVLKPLVAVVDVSKRKVIDFLAGPVVFTAKRNGDGESYALTDGQIEIVKQVLIDSARLVGIDLATGERKDLNLKILPYR